jgi:hypothetical protein
MTETLLSALEEREVFGFALQGRTLSELAERLEALAAGFAPEDYRSILAQAATGQDRGADPIPPQILAQMRLAEYFFQTEGDVAVGTVIIPMQVGLQRLFLQGGDRGLRRDLEQVYDALGFQELAEGLWLSLEVLGNAFPLEVWDGPNPLAVYILDPKTVWVGRAVFGSPAFALTGQAARDIRRAVQEGLVDRYTLAVLSAPADLNVKGPRAADFIPLDPGAVSHLKAPTGLPFWRYAPPPLSGCFRILSTRQVLEEAVRALIEGMKNQLWLYLLGPQDGSRQPSAAELQALRDQVAAAVGQRTGHLVWRGWLRVDVKSPQVDATLVTEKWAQLTLEIFRRRGVSLRYVSGESQGRDAALTDVKVLVQRLMYTRRKLLAWFDRFNQKFAAKNAPGLAQDRVPRAAFATVDLALENAIRERIIPLWNVGLLDPQQALRDAGYDYEQVLQNKREARSDEELFLPRPAFAQMVFGQGGPKTTLSPQGGRPREGEGPGE